MTDDLVMRARGEAEAALRGSGRDSRTLGAVMLQLTDRIEADAATIARLEGENLSRIDAMTLMRRKLAEWQASQHYTYIDKRGQPVLARDLEGRAEAAEAALAAMTQERDELRAAQHYRYIGKDGKAVLARDLEDAKDAAEARLAKAVEAAADAC